MLRRLRVDPDDVIEFIGMFMRAEYALKQAGFARGSHMGVTADWQRFGKTIAAEYAKVEDDDLRTATDYLLNQQPKKQVFVNEGLAWITTQLPPNPGAAAVLTMVGRVRNNLFHGAKFTNLEELREMGEDRDQKLVRAGLIVLGHAIRLDAGVYQAYL